MSLSYPSSLSASHPVNIVSAIDRLQDVPQRQCTPPPCRLSLWVDCFFYHVPLPPSSWETSSSSETGNPPFPSHGSCLVFRSGLWIADRYPSCVAMLRDWCCNVLLYHSITPTRRRDAGSAQLTGLSESGQFVNS